MSRSRPVPWIPPMLYGVVLVAGVYAWLAGLGDTTPVLFIGGLATLFVLDLIKLPPAVLLVGRLALFLAVAHADGSGLAKVLFVLLPFTAYFDFGRTVSIALGVACLALVLGDYALVDPDWYTNQERISDLLMFGIGIVLAIAMAAVAVEERRGRAQLDAYAARVAELSATAERNRLARDIHDGLGHHLTAIAVLLEQATAFAERDPAAAGRALADAHRSVRQALDDVRRSVRTLRAEPFRLFTALDDLVKQTSDGPPAVTLDLRGDERGHDQAVLTALYRAAQEGITNSRRHASASAVAVMAALDDSTARLTITDNGRGFHATAIGTGYGLLGLRERVELLGGHVDVDSTPGAGARVTVTIPRGAAG